MGKTLKKLNTSSVWIENPFRIEKGIFGPNYLGENVFAQFLQDLERFYLDLNQMREDLKLQELVTFPSNPDIKSLITLKGRLTEAQQEILKNKTRELILKIGVTNNWQIPLEVLVLTHVLPVPGRQEPFTLYLPTVSPPLPFFDPFNSMPKVLIQSPFTIEQFHRWIDNNKQILKEISTHLPKDPSKSNDPDTLFFSRIVFVLKEYEGKTSKQIADLLPIICKKLGTEPPDRTIDYKEVDDLYNSYKKYLKAIYKSGS